ncbi:MAG: class I SAM-dependent methyltransferase [bacterium]
MRAIADTINANIEYYDSLETPPPEIISLANADAVRKQVFERTGSLKSGAPGILEIGCGAGWLGCNLVVSGFAKSVISLDISLGMLEAAKKTAELNGIDAAHVKADAARLPFRDESLDFICGGGFLHHLDDEELFFREMHRTLKPGGMFLIFREPQKTGSQFVNAIIRLLVFLPGLFFKLFKRGQESFDHELEKSYSKRQLREYGNKASLEMVACNAHSLLHTVHWQVAYKLKRFGPTYKIVQPLGPLADFIDEKILRRLLPSVLFYEISACFRK